MPPKYPPSFESVLENSYWRKPDAAVALSALESSGLSLDAFCERHDLSPSRLARWRKTLGPSSGVVIGLAGPRSSIQHRPQPQQRGSLLGRHPVVVRHPHGEFDEPFAALPRQPIPELVP